MSTDFDEQHPTVLATGGTSDPRSKAQLVKQPVPVQKSILNLAAEEMIREAAEPPRHRLSNLSHITKKTLTRRSNLRHALADEKNKSILLNEQDKTSPLTQSNL